MAGVWIFTNDGVTRLVENPLADSEGIERRWSRRKVLVYVPTNQIITNYDELEERLRERGWKRYLGGDRNLRQYHMGDFSNDLISIPKSFADFKTIQMYDIVVKVPTSFQVRDAD